MLQRSRSRFVRMLRRFSHLIRFAIPMSIAVVLLGAGLLAGRISQVRAEEVAVAPDAPGSISGMVKDQHGAPLAGIRVDLYIFGYQDWLRTRQTATAADGTYTFSLLTTRNYRIGVADPAQVYAVSFFPNVGTLKEAQSIPVAGNNVTNIDLSLQPAGAIAGTVFITPPAVARNGLHKLLFANSCSADHLHSGWTEPGYLPGVRCFISTVQFSRWGLSRLATTRVL